ncbi:MAG: HK97 family phage prohead protease [Proteiniphilum sp.]
MEQLFYKSLSEVNDVSEGRIIGYANVYNVKDSDGDISLPGSFAKTVSERKGKMRIFKNHYPDLLVGVPAELDVSDPYGLKVDIKMMMDVDLGRDTWHEVKFLLDNGFETGLSIGGWVVKRSQKNAAEVVEYKLREISVLTSYEPANEFSLISAVKAVKELTEPTQEEFWKVIEKAYNGKFSDPILKSLEQFMTLKGKEPDELIETTPANEPSQASIIKSIYEQFKFM